jgi:hypothetical protein
MGCGVPNVLNNDMKKAFDITMRTIYKRSWAIMRPLGLIGYQYSWQKELT